MRFLSRFRSPPPSPEPEPSPLPEIIPPAPLAWPALFAPLALTVGSETVIAMHLRSEDEIGALRIADPARWARRCRYDGVALVLLTHAENLPAGGEHDAEHRTGLMQRLSDPSNLTVDRWNTALVTWQRDEADRNRLRYRTTALTGIGSKSVSRLMEVAELALHLAVCRGDLGLR